MNRVGFSAMIAGIVFLPLGMSMRRVSMVDATAPAAAMLNPSHDCAFCHDLHTSPGQTLTTNAVVETLCMTCHGPAGTSTLKAEVHSNKIGSSHAAFSFTCVDCHDPHDNVELGNAEGGTNLKLVSEQIVTPNSGTRDVVFESRGPDWSGATLHSFADTDEDNDGDLDGVCEVCHTLTLQHTNTEQNPHHSTGLTCTSCHPHEDKFLGTGGACDQCHNSPQAPRREVVSEFSQASHHLQNALDVADCEVCHDQGQHQQGNVRIFDVDGGATVELAGDPASSSTDAALLTTACLACHDSDGATSAATPLVPFTDAVTVPDVSANWPSASHNSTSPQVGCYGDGIFGCHASGHGSDKVTLLAPSSGAASPPDYAVQEEGFCYNCHDGSPASNVQSSFGGSIRHPLADSEQSGGRTVECTDCHNTHVASGASHNYNTTATSTRNQVSAALQGVPGLAVDYTGLSNFAAPDTTTGTGDYSTVAAAVDEYQICFKCHSAKSWSGGSPPNGLSPNGSIANPVMTDVAQEFSPNNRSGHPVVTGLDNYPNSTAVGSPARKGLQPAALKAPWNTNIGTQTMMCSDCHNTDAASPAAQGPHGSAVEFILRGPNTEWPPTVDFRTTSLPIQYGNSFCGNCHEYNNNDGPHREHDDRRDMYCYSCHVVIPHGSKMSRLIADNDAMPARYAFSNTLNTDFVQGFTKRALADYNKSDCRAQCAGAHRNENPTDNW